MKLTPLVGWLFCIPDSDETGSTKIIFPDERRKKKTTMTCVVHNALGDENFTKLRIIVEKWAWKEVVLRDVTFYVVYEGAVLGVIEEEDDMNRDALIEELQARIKADVTEVIPGNDCELTTDQAEQITSDVSITADDIEEILDANADEDKPEGGEGAGPV